MAVAKLAVKYRNADILGRIFLLVKLFKYLVINPIYGPFIAYCIANSATIRINDDFDNWSCPIKPTTIQEITTGIPKNANVLFLKFSCILSVFLVDNATTNCKMANITPKYCSGT